MKKAERARAVLTVSMHRLSRTCVITSVLSSKSLTDRYVVAAHHLDLRGPHKEDPHYVTDAREQEQAILASWLAEYYRRGY